MRMRIVQWPRRALHRHPVFGLRRKSVVRGRPGAHCPGPTGRSDRLRVFESGARRARCRRPSTSPKELLIRNPVGGSTTRAGRWKMRHVLVPRGATARGPFTGLMKRMAGNVPVGAIRREWLHSLEVDQTVNGFVAPARQTVRAQLIDSVACSEPPAARPGDRLSGPAPAARGAQKHRFDSSPS